MSPFALPAAAGLLLGLTFLSALAGYCLREFSFRRLEDICERHGHPERFGLIVKRSERALLTAEMLSTLCLLALVGLLPIGFGLWHLPADAAEWTAWVIALAGLVVTLLLAVVVLPRAVVHVAGERFLYRAWPLLTALEVVLRPMSGVALTVDRLAHRIAGRSEPEDGEPDAIAEEIREEIRSVVDEGQREGAIEHEAHSMINRVMELQEMDAAAIMTPRTEMVCIHVDSTLDEARTRLLDVGHSRVPVIGESTDDIVGILYAKDLLRNLSAGNGSTAALRDLVREPLYVPETTGIDTLLERMKREHVHIAIVIDEYSGVSGLVTMEDILEEIVGDITDEHDVAMPGVRRQPDGSVNVDGAVSIRDLNRVMEWNLPDEEATTIAGLVIHEARSIPEVGQSFTFHGFRFRVLRRNRNRITALRITPLVRKAPRAG